MFPRKTSGIVAGLAFVAATAGGLPCLHAFNPQPDGPVYAIVPESGSRPKVMVGGSFRAIAGELVAGPLARLNWDGTLDHSFHPPTISPGGVVNVIVAWRFAPDNYLVGGTFETVSGYSAPGLVRIRGDGVVLPFFIEFPVGEVRSIQLLSNRIIAAGKLGLAVYSSETGALLAHNVANYTSPGGTAHKAHNNVDDVYSTAVHAADASTFIAGGDFPGGVAKLEVASLELVDGFGEGIGFGVRKVVGSDPGGVLPLVTSVGVYLDRVHVFGDFDFLNDGVDEFAVTNAAEISFASGRIRQSSPFPLLAGHPITYDGKEHKTLVVASEPVDPRREQQNLILIGNFSRIGDSPSPCIGSIGGSRNISQNSVYPTTHSRLHEVDTGFGTTLVYPRGPRCIARISDNLYLIGGDFYTYNGYWQPYLARIDGAGRLDLTYPPVGGPQPEAFLFEIVAEPGQSLTFTLPPYILGYPPPNPAQPGVAAWRHNGSPIQPDPGDPFSLTIADFQAADAGTYEVTVTNNGRTGEFTMKAQLAGGGVVFTIDWPREVFPGFRPTWSGGELNYVSWTPATGEPMDIEISTDNGATWQQAAASLTGYDRYAPYGEPFGLYHILVPNVATTEARVRVFPTGDPGRGAMSDPFEIVAVALTPVQSWRMRHFGTELNAGDAADDADPDLDNLTNVFERILGSDPNNRFSRGSLRLRLGEGDVPAAEFTNGFEATDTVFGIEISQDLRSWSRVWDNLAHPGEPRNSVPLPMLQGAPDGFARMFAESP